MMISFHEIKPLYISKMKQTKKKAKDGNRTRSLLNLMQLHTHAHHCTVTHLMI
jgi:hypothetical protein